MTIHKLRRTFGTSLGGAGHSAHEVANLTGHSDIEMTGIYLHTSTGRRCSAAATHPPDSSADTSAPQPTRKRDWL